MTDVPMTDSNAAGPLSSASSSSALSALAMPTNMPLDDAASAPLPLSTNTPGNVYTEHNLSLRVPATIQLLAWRDWSASDVLEAGRRAVRGGGNVLGVGVPRPFANYDWTRYSDDIGSLFGYFWLMLFSVQYGAVRGDRVSADTIQQAWRFFQRQTKPWFERAGSAAVAWMDTAVRRVSNESGAAAQLDGALRSLQTIYLTGNAVQASFAQESTEYANQRHLVAAYDAQIKLLAAAAGVDLGGNSVMLDVLQQLVAGGQRVAQMQPALMLAAMLPSAPLLQLMRQTTAANPGAEKALRAALERAGKLEADVAVQKGTIKALKDTLAQSGDAGKMRDLEVAVFEYKKSATTAAELKALRTDIQAAANDVAQRSLASYVIPDDIVQQLRQSAAPGPRENDPLVVASQKRLTNEGKLLAELEVQRGRNSELVAQLKRAEAKIMTLQASPAELAPLRNAPAPSTSIADLARQLLMVREDNARLIAENKEKSDQNARLARDLVARSTSATVAPASASSPSSSTVAPASSVDSDLSRLQAEYERATDRINALNADIEAKNAEIEQLRAAQAAQAVVSEPFSRLMRGIAIQPPPQAAQNEIASLQVANAALEREKAGLVGSIGSLEAQIRDITARADAVASEKDSLAAESASLQEQVAAMGALAEARQRLEQEKIDLIATIQANVAQIEQLHALQTAQAMMPEPLVLLMRAESARPPSQDIEGMSSEIARLEMENAAQRAAMADNTNKISELMAESEEASAHQEQLYADNNTLRGLAGDQQAKNDELRQQLGEANERIRTLILSTDDRDSAIDDFTRQVAKLNRSLRSISLKFVLKRIIAPETITALRGMASGRLGSSSNLGV
jgi:hypothetical protein